MSKQRTNTICAAQDFIIFATYCGGGPPWPPLQYVPRRVSVRPERPVKFATVYEKFVDFVFICSVNEHTAQSLEEVLHTLLILLPQVINELVCVLVWGRSE